MVEQGELNRVLDELLHPTTSNERRREIEVLLERYRRKCFRRIDTCLHELQSCTDQSVLLFVLNCFERIICSERWYLISTDDKLSLHSHFIHYLIDNHQPSCTRHPLLYEKVVHLVGCALHWQWTIDFRRQMIDWLSTVESAQLSLNLLTKYAESIDSSRRYMLTNDANTDRGIFVEFCQNSGGLERISAILVACNAQCSTDDDNVRRILGACLNCINAMVENGDSARMFGNHLQQWIRLIGQIAINVCDDANAALCMNCISEMFARQCSLDDVQLGVIGAELCELARILSQRRRSDQFYRLLETIVLRVLTRPSIRISNLGDNFLSHLSTLTEQAAIDGDVDLLQQLLIDVWRVWMDTIELEMIDHRQIDNRMAPIYRWLQTFLANITDLNNLSASTYRHIVIRLSLPDSALTFRMDDEKVDIEDDDDDSIACDQQHCTWHSVITIVAQIVAKLSFIAPIDIFDLYRHRLEVNLDRLPMLATLDGSKRQFLFAAIQADTTIIGRLSHVHMDSSVVFQQQFAVCQQFAQKLCQSIDYLVQQQQSCSIDEQHCLCGLLQCAQSRIAWLLLFYAEAQRTGVGNCECSMIISSLINASLSLIVNQWLIIDCTDDDDPNRIVQTAASLIHSLLTTIRPHSFVLEMASLANVYDRVSKCTIDSRQPMIQRRLLHLKFRRAYTAFAGYLCLPWTIAIGDDEQQWTHRRTRLTTFLHNTCLVSTGMTGGGGTDPITDDVHLRLSIAAINDVIKLVRNETTKCKTILYDAIGRQWFAAIIEQIRIGCVSPEPSWLHLLLDHVDIVLKSLVNQLGVDYVQAVVNTLLVVVGAENSLLSDSAARSLFDILHTVVEHNKKPFRHLDMTNDVVALVLRCRFVIDRNDTSSSIDTKEAYYRLTFALIDHRWRHFFPSSIWKDSATESSISIDNQHQFTNDGSAISTTKPLDMELRVEQFTEIMTQIVLTAVRVDTQPTLIRHLLIALCNMHDGHKLFSTPIFVRDLSMHLLSVIFDRAIIDASSFGDELCALAHRIIGASTITADRFQKSMMPDDESIDLTSIDRFSFDRHINDIIVRLRVVQMQTDDDG